MTLLPSSCFRHRNIDKSVRFDDSVPCYFSYTGVTSYLTKWTFAGWFKRGSITVATAEPLFSCLQSANNYTGLWFPAASDQLRFGKNVAGTYYTFTTTRVFRDPTGWFHVVAVWDTDNVAPSERVRLYINGVRAEGTINVAIPLGLTSHVNVAANAFNIGRFSDGSAAFNGTATDLHFVDGQTLDHNSFLGYDSDNLIWLPREYSGTFIGNNDWQLLFDDATSVSTLGYDTSGFNHNFTPSGLTRVAPDDCVVSDSPTNNFCTMDGSDMGSVVLNGGGLRMTDAGSTVGRKGTFGITEGKWYWEVTIATVGTAGSVGISRYVDPDVAPPTVGAGNMYAEIYTGNKTDGSSSTGSAYDAAVGSAWAVNSTLGIAYDADNQRIWISYQGEYPNSGDPTNGSDANCMYSGIAPDTWYPYSSQRSAERHVNFGQLPFVYAPPLGYSVLSARNSGSLPFFVPKRFFSFLYNGNSAINALTVPLNVGVAYLKPRGGTYYGHIVNKVQYPSSLQYTPGSYSWIVPSYVTSGVLSMAGAGGGAGSSSGVVETDGGRNFEPGHGGGGAAPIMKTLTFVPGDTYNLVVGSRGIGQSGLGSLGPGTDGGNTTFDGPVGSFYSRGGYGGWSGGWGTPAITSGVGGTNSDGVLGPNQSNGLGGGLLYTVYGALAQRGNGGSLSLNPYYGPGGDGGEGYINLDISNNFLPSFKIGSTAVESVTANAIKWSAQGITLGSSVEVNNSLSSYIGHVWPNSLDSGLEVIPYTGTGAPLTLNHHLGVKPAFILFRRLDVATNAVCYHQFSDLTSPDDYVVPVTNNPRYSSAGYWTNIDSTSVVLDTNATVNAVNGRYVAFVWAQIPGLSSFGYYNGTGTVGPTVFTGHQPAFLMIKAATYPNSHWRLGDSLRNPYNPVSKRLWFSDNVGEDNAGIWDFRAVGFKIREGSSYTETNASGNRYIYVSFAKYPLSLATAF